MLRTKRWNEEKLRNAVKKSVSIRQVLILLGLVEAGGNYEQIKRYIKLYTIDTSHFLGKQANKGKKFLARPTLPLNPLFLAALLRGLR